MIGTMKLFSVFFITAIIVHCSSALAKEKRVDQSDVMSPSLNFNSRIADWVDRQAHNIDLALSGARYTDETDDSEARFSQRMNWNEKEGVNFETDFDVQLALPNLEKKYKLMLSSYNENQTRRSAYSRFGNIEEERSNYGADFSFLRRIGDFDVTFRPRIQFGSPFKTFYNLSFESEYKKNNRRFRTRFSFFADSDKGTGQFTSLTLERFFWTYWGDSIVLEEEYQDGQNIFSLLQGYSINRVLTSRISVAHSIVVSSDNEKSNFRLKNLSFGPSFNHELYPGFFNYTVMFTESYDIEYKFKGNSILSLIIEIIF